jgi:hypothetical protein
VASILLIVIVVAPVPVKIVFVDPPILIEFRLIVGTLLMVHTAPAGLITTSSPAAGTVPPDQLAPTAQDPEPPAVHVFNAAWD